MATLKRWDGTTHKSGGTLKRWDGSAFKTGATLRRWTGTDWQPPLSVVSGFVGATSLYSTSSPVLTVPAGVVSTDLMVLAVSSGNALASFTVPGATALTGPTDTGTMQGEVLTGTGYTAGGTITFGSASNTSPSAIVAAWYRGYTSTGGTATAVKSGTVTTLVAPDVTDDTTGDKIVTIFMEKSGSNVVTTVPAVTGVTNRAWVPWASNATGLPSAWIGDYSAPAAAKTITYPQSSANGLAVQLRLRP